MWDALDPYMADTNQSKELTEEEKLAELLKLKGWTPDADLPPDQRPGYQEPSPTPTPVPAPTPGPTPEALPEPLPAVPVAPLAPPAPSGPLSIKPPISEVVPPAPPVDKKEALRISLKSKMSPGAAAQPELPEASIELSPKEKLYEDLKAKYTKKYDTDAAATEKEAQDAAEKSKMSGWRSFLGTIFMSIGVGPKAALEYADKMDADKAKLIMDQFASGKKGAEKAMLGAEKEIGGDPLSRKSVLARQFIQKMAPGIATKLVGFDKLSYDQLAERFPQAKELMEDETKRLGIAENAKYRQALMSFKQETAAAKPKPPTTFESIQDKQQGKSFAKLQEDADKTDTNLETVDDALKQQLAYSKGTTTGTGPVATWLGRKTGGLTQSEDTQKLNSALKLVNLKNMVQAFQGMSRAVDSDTERAAWETTQASLENDDKVNVKILLGTKSLLLKSQAEAAAQREWVDQYGNLRNYKSPVLGKYDTVVDRSGTMTLIPKGSKIPEGQYTLDQFVPVALGGKQPNVKEVNTGLTVGDVSKGYVYQGGDPKDPKSWRKQ